MKRKYQVGGVVYDILQSKRPTQEKIDIKPIKSMVHKPIVVDRDVKIKSYEPQYNFNKDAKSNAENTISENTIIELKRDVPMLEIDQVSTQPKLSTSSNENVWNDVWNQYGSALGLKDNKAYLYLLGQIKHESGDFQHMEEIADGSAYEGREDLGNTKKGDGKRFKGRGPVQVTGRANYEKIYNDFFVPNGLGEYDIVNNPELANDPRIGSLLSMGWFAVTDQGARAIASANNYDIRGVTKAINGGYNGLEDRIKRTNELLRQYS